VRQVCVPYLRTMETKGERSFSFLRINQRKAKPRTRGLTEIRGPYYSVVGRRYLEDLFELVEMVDKPIACQFGHVLQCTRLLKQMRCAGNNLHPHFAAHLVGRHFV
jgi:hypothetical protein